MKHVLKLFFRYITKVVFSTFGVGFHGFYVDTDQQVLSIKAVIVGSTVSNRACSSGMVEQLYDRINRYALKTTDLVGVLIKRLGVIAPS